MFSSLCKKVNNWLRWQQDWNVWMDWWKNKALKAMPFLKALDLLSSLRGI